MNITKLDNGKYRIREMIEGKSFSVTIGHKPTQKEARKLLDDKIYALHPTQGKMTVVVACREYINSKKNVLSPVTVRYYLGIIRTSPEWFMDLDLNEMSNLYFQKYINEVQIGRSPKTVRNYYGFMTAVFSMFIPDFKYKITLPQKIKTKNYIPSSEDVARILEYTEGTDMHTVIALACYGLRRSEAICITSDDLNGNMLTINKAKVINAEGKGFTVKTTKTVESNRTIPIPEWLADEIRSKGYAYKGHPNNIVKYLHKVQKELGIPEFRYHLLRHYFCSALTEMGVDAATIQKLGGWSTDNIMKSVYRHSMTTEEKEQAIADALSKKICPEICPKK